MVFVWLHSYFWKPKKDISNDRTKVLLIGLDGATWDVMYPLVKQNKLPNIKRLMNKGCWGGLQADSMTSEVSWTNIATGKTPQKHGIIDRLMKDSNTGELIPATSNLRKVKVLWSILAEHDKSVSVVGYILTWPPEEINKGIIISDRTYKVNYPAEGYTYPSLIELCNQQEFRGFKATKEKIFSQIEEDKFPSFSWDAEMRDNFMAKFANYLMDKRDSDFLTIYLLGTDRVSHYFWKYMEPDGFNVTKEEIKRYGNIIKDYYIHCDRLIGDLLNKIDKDTIVVIVSNHGFGPFRRAVHLNSWLKANGFLSLREDKQEGREFFEDVDWSRTKAYALGFGGIYINQIGREGKGVVEAGIETEETKKAILEKLSGWRDADNSLQPVMKKVYTKEEIFNGPYSAGAPDLFVGFNTGFRASWQTALGAVPKNLIEDNLKRWSGDHLFDPSLVPGIFLVNRKIDVKDPKIIDIAPTILKLLDITSQEKMDGSSLF